MSSLISHCDKYTLLVYSQQYTLEAKYFIPEGQVDWFTNPILTPDSFEEWNLPNISPTIKVDIFVDLNHVEHIFLRATCWPQEVKQYKALFQEFCDVFTWSYTEIPRMNPTIV